ncbi:glutamate receptor 2.7-like [Asparagus officinalis]|nr:glutamate receptor 2.7-like [Asparagus officinalis]
MALEDFYVANPNYTTRLNLHLRDSGNTAFGAAVAALDLLQNVQVQAIIGPQTSTEAKFVIELGDKAHVPIISFSAKSPSLSHQKNPYFIRTGLSDYIQSKVIASIVQFFKWKEVVPLFEDTEYGNGIIPYLIDALQEVEAHVTYRSSLPLSATKVQIMEELDKLKSMRTRVFVVHMTYSLGLQLFKHAKEAGMMGEGYVWIATYGLTDIVDLMGSSVSHEMQGVLGVKPYVRESNKLSEFKLRWKKKFKQVNFGAKISEPTVFGLWAYDTVWSLALSAQNVYVTNSTFQGLNTTDNATDFARLGLSSSGPLILNQMLGTKFDGISGEFELINGQLESKRFEIINVVDNGKKTIGFCTLENNTSWIVHFKDDPVDIMWPGGKKVVPKGWEWPTMGRELRIGIPVKPGFGGFVRIEDGSAKGYCIEVFNAVMTQMPYKVSYKYIPYEDAHGNMNGTYDDLVYEVFRQKYDAVVGDITIIANRSLYVDFTLPYTESGVSMLVPIKDKRHKGAWTFLEPLSTDLWLASAAFFIFTGFVVWFLEHRINEEFRGTISNQLGTIFYFAFSTLVFAHREKVLGNLARIVVIIWVFVVLVLQSSYTASLTSKLTVEQLQPTVADINELLKNGDSVGYLDDSFMPGLLKQLNFHESKIIPYKSPEDYNEAMSNGTVAAIFDEIPYLRVFLSKYCGKYTMTGPTYKTDGFGFAFPKGSPLVPDISRAVLKVMEGEIMTKFEKEPYVDGNCSDQEDSTTTSNSLRKITSLAKVYDQRDPSSVRKKDEAVDRPASVGDIMLTPCTMSAPQSPLSILNPGDQEGFETDEGEGMVMDDDDDGDAPGTPGREINSQNPDPPSFAEMLPERNSGSP